MATFTVNLTGYTTTADQIRWDDNVGLPATFDLGGNTQTLSQIILRTSGAVRISILGTNRRFTPEFEETGRIIFTASDGETLEVMIANADMTEAYEWTPANSAEVIAFITHERTLTDHDATLTLTDDPAIGPPVFADNTGNAQTWAQNVAITPVTVPEASGSPAPTYAATGLPTGINFDTGTRVISGTPTAVGTGTITVTATNSEGSDAWTVAYTTTAVSTLLTLADFDQSNINVVFAGLIIAGSDAQSGGTAIYVSDVAGVPWTATGTLVDGNLDYDGATAALTRVMFTASAIRFNDNQTGDTGDLDAFMSMPGMSIFLTVDDGGSVVTHEGGYTPGGTGGNYYNFTFDDAATDTAFRALAVGDRFVFAMGVPTPPGDVLDVAATFPGAGGNISAAVTKVAAAVLLLPDPPDTTHDWGDAITLTLPEASDGTPPYVYSVSAIPLGMAFDANTRVLSGTPDLVADHRPTYTVTDSATPPATASQEFLIQVNGIVPQAPLLFLTAVSSTVTRITKTPPTNTGGLPLTGFPLQVSINGGAFQDVTTIAPDAMTYDHTGLSGLNTYDYRLYAENSAGRSTGFGQGQRYIPGNRDVAATFPGAAGSIAAAVSIVPGVGAIELPVAATFPGAAGSIAAAVTRVVNPSVNRPVAATFTGAAGNITAAVTTTSSFVAQHFPRFGFNGNGVGFGQGPFASAFQFRHRPTPEPVSWKISIPRGNVRLVIPPPPPVDLSGRVRVADGILDADDAVALLLSQWRETTTLPLLTRELMGVARRRLVEPLQRLEDMRNIELAEGVWLDYIGERLGFRRPYVATRNVEYFGFKGNGVGFNQGPFRSTLVDTFNLSPVVDGVYRDCLKVWAGTLLHDGTIPVMAAAVRRVFPAAYYVDGLNGTLTLNIRTGQTVSKQVMTDFDVFPHPSGVALTVV